ncbi:MAG: hypothetical protein ACXWCG_08695 [Flavitalea sp.]
MTDYVINVTRIEELQNLNDINELWNIFNKAKSAIVNGAIVNLVRKTISGSDKFDEFATLEDLERYRKQVMKYVRES